MKHKIRHKRRPGRSSSERSEASSRSRSREREKRGRPESAQKKRAGGERLKRKGSFFEDVHE